MPSSTAPAGAPRPRLSREERRRSIASAARDVFIAQGYEAARTKDIASAAGVNEALLYRHFPSKGALFKAAVVDPLEEAVAKLVVDSGAPPLQHDETGGLMEAGILAFVRDLVDVLEEIAPLLGVMIFGDIGNAPAYYQSQVTPILSRIAAVVSLNSAVWPHRDFDVDVLVRMGFGAVWMEAVHARMTGQPMDKDRVAEQISSVLVRGLLEPPA